MEIDYNYSSHLIRERYDVECQVLGLYLTVNEALALTVFLFQEPINWPKQASGCCQPLAGNLVPYMTILVILRLGF